MIEANPTQLADILRALKGMDKIANKELRAANKAIVERVMAPAFRRAAWHAKGDTGRGQVYTASGRDVIYPKSDRIPHLLIGRKVRSYSGGASSIMVRHKSGSARWLPTAKQSYRPQLWAEWLRALDAVAESWRSRR